jgi:glyoxylase-like metal-dependent hydrolase (beta-lactamase superfamily II)
VEKRPVPLHAANPGPLTGEGTNTWMIAGAEPTLIDAGVGAPAHLAALADELAGQPLARVLVTHGHSDHASGAPALRGAWPGVELCRFGTSHEPGWRMLHDGDRVHAGDATLEVIHTPGHAPDHVCFWNAASGDLFGGDLVLLETTVVIPAGHGGDLRAYLASLSRVAALEPVRIYPGHGPVIERPLDVIAGYIAHRRSRERQVIRCIEQGVRDPDQIVDRIYPALPSHLRDAARMTIVAHLEKLEHDGRLD